LGGKIYKKHSEQHPAIFNIGGIMKYRSLLLISLVTMLLAGCSTGGPSNAEAQKVIYGVYFLEASILEKRQCE
jgi:hypothetical protein